MSILSPPLLALAPELAVLYLLAESLGVTTVVLLAAHPELSNNPPLTRGSAIAQADQITLLIEKLQDAVAIYVEHTEEQVATFLGHQPD
ncbi:hypothetical protein KJ611_04975 [Patescibacteria group bacterium]|nr:hypothetical protein [Patescibacteria group bacterium]